MTGDELQHSEQVTVAVPRLGYVDQLRALAALYVAVFHALLVLWPQGGPEAPWYLQWADHGHFGVTAFIVLSGFSLALKPAVREQSTAGRYWPFMLKRGLRLLPPYWVALAGSIFLLYLAPGNVAGGNSGGAAGEWTGKGPVPLRSIFGFFFLVQDIFRLPSPNSPMWSIAVEWHLYFLFPLLVFVGCRYGMRWLLAGSAVVALTLHYLLWGTDAQSTTPHFLVLFTIGIVTAYAIGAFVRGAAPPPWLASINGWLLIGLSFVVFVLMSEAEVAADLVAGSIFAVGIYVLGLREQPTLEASRRISRVGGAKALMSIGLISYSVYLVHSPTEKIVWHFVVEPLDLNPSIAFVLLAVVGIGLSLGAAYVLYLVIERRSMGWSRRISVSSNR
jgi:peptidoglycan/LPS O-acetylase OafA/YrhL